ncbi:MAG: hypothetical protein Q7S57_01830 [bacterium]|nr:hypothetical protein [bacterium]
MNEQAPRFNPEPEQLPEAESGQAKSESIEKVEMPADFVEPEGKPGKWGEIVENKDLGIRYREKVIELPKHRQEETGVKRIRRREMLPPFPEGFLVPAGETKEEIYQINKEGEALQEKVPFFSAVSKFDDVYSFLTDGEYPNDSAWIHALEIGLITTRASKGDGPARRVRKFIDEGMYFQEIFPRRTEDVNDSVLRFYKNSDDGVEEIYKTGGERSRAADLSGEFPGDLIARSEIWCTTRNLWMGSGFRTPVFVFSNRSENLNEYIDSVMSNPDTRKMAEDPYEEKNEIDLLRPGTDEYEKKLQILKPYLLGINPDANYEQNLKENNVLIPKTYLAGGTKTLRLLREGTPLIKNLEPKIPLIRHPDIKPLRWCHAELALVPTKRSLNILFFETE